MDDIVPSDPDANAFIDNVALRELTEKIVDHNRSLGLTVDPNGVQFSIHPQHGMLVMIPALVRPSAKTKMDEDRASRETFNQMMAENAEAKVQDTLSEIAKIIGSDDMDALLFGDEPGEECTHENMHPSGFCLDCKHGL